MRIPHGIFDYKGGTPTPSYPTDGLIDRWTFEESLTGDNGNTWSVDGTFTYDYSTGIIPGTKCIRQTNTEAEKSKLYINENIFPTFDASIVDWTIAYWAYIPSGSTTQNQHVFGKGNWFNIPSWMIQLENGATGGVWKNLKIGNYGSLNTATVNLSTPSWYHFIVTLNRTSLTTGTYYAYINNVLKLTGTTGLPNVNTTDFNLFNNWGDACLKNTMVDQFYMYNRVLSEVERAQLYNGGAGI